MSQDIPVAATAATPGAQVLTFLVGGERFGIDILCIKEIIEFGRPTPVPMMPAFLRGVINLRGTVVPVIDLAARFGRVQAVVGKRTCIVIVEVPNGGRARDVGVVVDAVCEVVDIPDADIGPVPELGTGVRPDFISAMARDGDGFVMLLDTSAVLSVAEMADLVARGQLDREQAA